MERMLDDRVLPVQLDGRMYASASSTVEFVSCSPSVMVAEILLIVRVGASS